jgi:hypothetical protein
MGCVVGCIDGRDVRRHVVALSGDQEWGAAEVDGWVTALLPLGAALLAVASYKLIHVWDVTSAERVAVLEGHTVGSGRPVKG